MATITPDDINSFVEEQQIPDLDSILECGSLVLKSAVKTKDQIQQQQTGLQAKFLSYEKDRANWAARRRPEWEKQRTILNLSFTQFEALKTNDEKKWAVSTIYCCSLVREGCSAELIIGRSEETRQVQV
jgi:hypothetical protein